MNYIDENFYNLIYAFENTDIYAMYNHMVKGFKKIPEATQKSVENFFRQFNYWGEIDIADENFESFFQKAQVFKNHTKDYLWLYSHLADARSKHLLYAILNNYYNFDFSNLSNASNFAFKQYFDLDLVPKCSDEVFVDVGTYIGDSVLDYISSYGENSYKKIYCYDITQTTLEKAKFNLQNYKNIEYKNCAVTNFSGTIGISCNDFSPSANTTTQASDADIVAVKLDEDIDEKITMIKMDIEGGEKNALLGAQRHIKEDAPKLFISVYHNNTDIFELPKLIESFNPRYKFYLRYYGGPIYPTEIVLIALTDENLPNML